MGLQRSQPKPKTSRKVATKRPVKPRKASAPPAPRARRTATSPSKASRAPVPKSDRSKVALTDAEIMERFSRAKKAATPREAIEILVGVYDGPNALSSDEVMRIIRDGGDSSDD